MTRPDPMQAANVHVRAFAKAHRLRVVVREDGEVSLPLGPRKAQTAHICRTGAVSLSDHHASYGLRPGRWTLFVGPMTPRRLGAIVSRWRSLGLTPRVLDFEAWADVPEDRFLDVTDAHSLTRLRRRRRVSPEIRSAATARLAALRAKPPAPPTVSPSRPVARRADAETAEESSTTAATNEHAEPAFLGGGAS